MTPYGEGFLAGFGCGVLAIPALAVIGGILNLTGRIMIRGIRACRNPPQGGAGAGNHGAEGAGAGAGGAAV